MKHSNLHNLISPSLSNQRQLMSLLCSFFSYTICLHFFLLFFLCFQATPNDGLPPIVCIKCREQLDSCHRFRRAAHQTHQALVDYLQFTSKLNGTPQVSFMFFFIYAKLYFGGTFAIDRERLPAPLRIQQIYESFVQTFSAQTFTYLFIMQFNCDMSRSFTRESEHNRQIHLNMSLDT